MAIARTNSHFASRRVLGGVLGGVGAPGGEVGASFGETRDGVDGGGNCGLASTRAGSTFSFIETTSQNAWASHADKETSTHSAVFTGLLKLGLWPFWRRLEGQLQSAPACGISAADALAVMDAGVAQW